MLLKRRIKKQIIINIIKILAIVIIIYLLLFHIFGFYIVKSDNMNPSIKSGTLLIYYRLNNKYERNDIVIFKNKIYRIIGVNKDKIEILNNNVIINGIKEEENIFYNTYEVNTSKIKYPYEIVNNEYFLLNDYRLDNNDSRLFGAVKKDKLKGKIIGSIQIRGF